MIFFFNFLILILFSIRPTDLISRNAFDAKRKKRGDDINGEKKEDGLKEP